MEDSPAVIHNLLGTTACRRLFLLELLPERFFPPDAHDDTSLAAIPCPRAPCLSETCTSHSIAKCSSIPSASKAVPFIRLGLQCVGRW